MFEPHPTPPKKVGRFLAWGLEWEVEGKMGGQEVRTRLLAREPLVRVPHQGKFLDAPHALGGTFAFQKAFLRAKVMAKVMTVLTAHCSLPTAWLTSTLPELDVCKNNLPETG